MKYSKQQSRLTWRMKVLICVVFGLTILVSGRSKTNAGTPTDTTFRRVHGLVLGMDGKPEIHRHVILYGLSRCCVRKMPWPILDYTPGWDFTTDANGRFTAQFGKFNTWEDKQERPGWGDYALVVESLSNDAGAVSPRFSNYALPSKKEVWSADWDQEWGDWQALTDADLAFTLKIQSGVTLEGTVYSVTDPTQPLADVNISSFNDLHADTHNGHGGEIVYQGATTDAKGHFRIPHIFPRTFYLGMGGCFGFHGTYIGGDLNDCWIKTKYRGKTTCGPLDVLTPEKGSGQEKLSIVIFGSKAPHFRYYGRVINEQGQPVPNAKVAFGMSYHPQSITFEDDHCFLETKTDGKGYFEIKLGTPWVRGMDAEAEGYVREDRWATPETINYGPGEYNFTLKTAFPTQ